MTKVETEKRDNAIGYFQNLAMSPSPWEREYANIVLKAIYKTVDLKPVVHGKYGFICPFCKTDLGIETEDITVYDVDPPKHCKECGQALDWSDVKCRI